MVCGILINLFRFSHHDADNKVLDFDIPSERITDHSVSLGWWVNAQEIGVPATAGCFYQTGIINLYAVSLDRYKTTVLIGTPNPASTFLPALSRDSTT